MIFSEATATARAATAFSFTVLATNAGLENLDAAYTLNVSGLPAWLSAGPLLFNKSTASRTLTGTPPPGNLAGTLNLSISATNSNGSGAAAPLAITLVPLPPLEGWRYAWFQTIENAGEAADDADPDLDGVENRYKFALGTDPKGDSSASRPQATVREGHLTLTYTRNKAATALTFTVEAGSELTAGSLLSAGVEQRWQVIDGATTETITARDPVPVDGQTQRYIRLRVTTP